MDTAWAEPWVKLGPGIEISNDGQVRVHCQRFLEANGHVFSKANCRDLIASGRRLFEQPAIHRVLFFDGVAITEIKSNV